ncbi:MAG: ABC transporter permease, partial [Chloroflexota bacterium]
SPPSAVALKLATLVQSPTVWRHLGVSALELLLSYSVAVGIGILGGLVLGSIQFLRRVFMPYILILFSFPKIAIFPLFILWFGIGLNLKVAYAALSGLFPIVVMVVAGFAAINPRLLAAARSMGASRLQIYVKVILPSLVPMLFAGLRVGLNFTILGVLVAELVQSREGIGTLIEQATVGFRADEVYALVVLTAAIVLVMNGILGLIEGRVAAWTQ